MIDKSVIEQLANQWLEGKDYFLTDIRVTDDNVIAVEIDHQDGVWIEDCVELSRHIEQGLDRDKEDFELEVGSAGLGQPFKVLRQYEIHEGSPVDVVMRDGRKLHGTLRSTDAEGFTLIVEEKVKKEGEKRPKLTEVPYRLAFADVKETRYRIEFK